MVCLVPVEVKTMYGKTLVGKNLATLARVYVRSEMPVSIVVPSQCKPCSVYRYVAAMNEGNTPTIATAWTRVVEAQCEEAVEKAIQE